jgi:cytochrome c553
LLQAMKFIASLLLAACVAAPAFAVTAAAPAAGASTAAAPAAGASAAAATPVVAKMAKPDLAKGAEKFTAVCASCHGADGNSGSPENPKLAGQHPEYLVKQLMEFKTGKRKNAIMQGFASTLSDEDMRNVAFWATAQKQKPGFAKDKDLVALGEKIYKGGIADRQIAACAGCHSPTGAGIPSQFPRLAGQHADYVASSLRGYRDGTRNNNIQMTQNAAKLNDREIKAVSDYVAGLR